jgi:protein-tyrosine-phosphatase
VLFVCTGNTCRSPMAAAWFRHLCEQRKLTFVQVRSAGTDAGSGVPMSGEARTVLTAEDVPPGPHQSRALSAQLLRESDVVIAMTEAHRRQVLTLLHEARDKTQTLLNILGQPGDIPDPIGGSIADYAHCLDVMKPALAALADRLATTRPSGSAPLTPPAKPQ